MCYDMIVSVLDQQVKVNQSFKSQKSSKHFKNKKSRHENSTLIQNMEAADNYLSSIKKPSINESHDITRFNALLENSSFNHEET